MAAAPAVAGVAGRRLVCRLHLGRARTAARRTHLRVRCHQRRQCRCGQRRALGERADGGRPRDRARAAAAVLGTDDAGSLVPLADADRRLFAGRKLRVLRPGATRGPCRSIRSGSVARGAGEGHQLRRLAGSRRTKASGRGDAGARRLAADLRQRGSHAGYAARLGLSAAAALRGRDRRRILLGRRLWRQSAAGAAGAGIAGQ